ncbi:hypothetical protein LCGC14_0568910 [marine sediment metagenome]|uniref:Uncharacterized protein n=1 Tax=marine sediment metagenome TaxID=412755 RepID=A0A0F9RJV6_9ZZZZ|nr:hypothetical protein [Phycisphaerae bacterium]
MAVILSASTGKFEKGMGKAQKTTRTFAMKFRSFAKGVAIGFAVIAAAATAMATVVAVKLIAMTKAGFASADILAKTASKLGISTQALAAFRLAAAKAGVNVTTFDMALQRMTRRISEAAVGTGEAQGALKEMGINAKKLGALGLDKQFEAIVEAWAGISQKDKVRLAFKLFDSEGVALKNLLDAGSEALEDARERTKRFGTALSAIDTKKIEIANDAILDIREAMTGFGQQLALRVAPFVFAIAKWLGDAADISAVVEGIWKGLMHAAAFIAEVWQAIAVSIKATEVSARGLFAIAGLLGTTKFARATLGGVTNAEALDRFRAVGRAGEELDAIANRDFAAELAASLARMLTDFTARVAAKPDSDIPSFNLTKIAADIKSDVGVIRESVQRQATNTAALLRNVAIGSTRSMIGAVP